MIRVVVVGAGGNIGSHLIPHLARMRAIDSLVLIDPDRYEPRNHANQNIGSGAIGRPKVRVQAAVARAINPALRIETFEAAVQHVPPGRLRSDVVLGCVDSRSARLHLNRLAGILGLFWLDAGVRADGALVRVTALRPAAGQPCLECGWSAADYAAVDQSWPCRRARSPAAQPGSALGAMAASLQAMLVGALLSGSDSAPAPGTEVVVDPIHQRLYRTMRPRHPACAGGPHQPWTIERLENSAARTLGHLMEQIDPAGRNRLGQISLAVEGARFARALICACGARRPVAALERTLGRRTCRACHRLMIPDPMALTDRLSGTDAWNRARNRPLRSLGIRAGDIVTVEDGRTRAHFEVAV
jgi:molybdopterin/thiamine biosynthesis adenylyltransferase